MSKEEQVFWRARKKIGLPRYASKLAVVSEVCRELRMPLPVTWELRHQVLREWVQGEPKMARHYHHRVQADDFLQSYEWRRLRMVVLTERGARCECCGATPHDGVVLNVDHIKPRKHYPELALVKSNLQVLCDACNHGKGNWDQTDWRVRAVSKRLDGVAAWLGERQSGNEEGRGDGHNDQRARLRASSGD